MIVAVLLAAALDTVAAQAPAGQKRPYNIVMKEAAAAAEALRKNLDSGKAASDAEKLARLFQELEDFWAAFRTRDAIEAAKGARELSAAVAAAVRAKDLARAKKEAAGLGRFCTACHNSHREQMPDKTYRIRP
jgi:hypothetical protein